MNRVARFLGKQSLCTQLQPIQRWSTQQRQSSDAAQAPVVRTRHLTFLMCHANSPRSAQAPPGDRMFYKGQTLTFQKGYANAADDEVLPLVNEVASTSHAASQLRAAAAESHKPHTCSADPKVPQWLENDRQARSFAGDEASAAASEYPAHLYKGVPTLCSTTHPGMECGAVTAPPCPCGAAALPGADVTAGRALPPWPR